jgi:hypothetical protein
MGLVYLNARYYDPAASRFVSPDPVVNPSDPRTLDAYMYGANNPISFMDASGKTPYYQGNTQVLPEYWADGSQYVVAPLFGSATINHRQAGVGAVGISVWIASSWAGVPGFGAADAKGDNRGRTTDLGVMWGASRWALQWDVGSGAVKWKTGPSCDWPNIHECASPNHPKISIQEMTTAESPFASENGRLRKDLNVADPHSFVVSFSFDGQDSWNRPGPLDNVKPTLQQKFYVLVHEGQSQVSVFYDGDSYPSRQIIRVQGGVSHDVFYAGESFLGAAALALSGPQGYGGTG